MIVDGKVALITGGAQGLGKGFAKILLQQGAKVLLTDLNEEVGHATRQEFQNQFGQNTVIFIKADVTSEADMQKAFQQAKATFGRLDIVVNNAGIGGEGDDIWEKCVDINLKGPIRGTRLALSYLRRDKGGEGGVIINVASAGGLRPQPAGPVYSGTKSGVVMFSRSVAANKEYLENGIRVNTLCPAFVDTALVASLTTGSVDVDSASAKKKLKEAGIMTVDEVAEAFYELVTDDTKNGAVLAISKNQGKMYVPFPEDQPPSQTKQTAKA